MISVKVQSQAENQAADLCKVEDLWKRLDSGEVLLLQCADKTESLVNSNITWNNRDSAQAQILQQKVEIIHTDLVMYQYYVIQFVKITPQQILHVFLKFTYIHQHKLVSQLYL